MNEFSLINPSYGQHDSFFFFSYYNRKGPDKNNIQIPVQLDHHHRSFSVCFVAERVKDGEQDKHETLFRERWEEEEEEEKQNRKIVQGTQHTRKGIVSERIDQPLVVGIASHEWNLFKYGILGSSSYILVHTAHYISTKLSHFSFEAQSVL